MTFTVERKSAGRRIGGHCRRAARHSRRGRRCTRYVRAGSFTRSLNAGRRSVSFSGRLRGRALRRATYRIRVQARDAAGNRSAKRVRPFRVVR